MGFLDKAKANYAAVRAADAEAAAARAAMSPEDRRAEKAAEKEAADQRRAEKKEQLRAQLAEMKAERGIPVEGHEGVLFTGKSHEDGRNSLVTLYSDRLERVKAKRVGSLSNATQGVEVTPARAISSVETKKDGLVWTKVTVYASGNNIVFRLSHQDAARFKDILTKLLLAPTQPAAAQPDVTDQIRKLGELRDSGVLSEDEFAAKKAELLARL